MGWVLLLVYQVQKSCCLCTCTKLCHPFTMCALRSPTLPWHLYPSKDTKWACMCFLLHMQLMCCSMTYHLLIIYTWIREHVYCFLQCPTLCNLYWWQRQVDLWLTKWWDTCAHSHLQALGFQNLASPAKWLKTLNVFEFAIKTVAFPNLLKRFSTNH